MVIHSIYNYISVFSGGGGLDLAVQLAVPKARCVCHVEIEVAAATILASRMAEGSLDEAPIWSDARTFDGRPWRGRVGGIIAGFPCPDYSVAGQRKGITGEHGQLWYPLASIIREVGPSWIFLENVPGILNPHRNKETKEVEYPAGIDFVLGDLAEMGFDAEWGCCAASAVGASHKRERWWCLAVANTLGAGLEEWRCERGDDGAECAATERASVPFFAPGPSSPDWADLLVRYPWMRPALAQAEAQSVIYRDFDGMAALVADTRTDALRAAGNGAVALAGASALRELLRRIS